MNYREFGKTGEMLSVLGFGAMRLPLINGEDANIDYEKATEMVRYAIDNGVNYLDTGYTYHGGTSEAFCGHVMKDGYRSKVNIATKLPSWDIEKHSDMEEKLNEQLERLDVKTIDFYLLHALGKNFWPKVRDNDYKSFLKKAKAEGKIRYIGFSYHDDFELFKDIVDDYDWDFCQIQLNYLDENYQAGLKGMNYASERGLGVIIMEPLRGGMLAQEPPKGVQDLWDKSSQKRSPTEWALKYLYSKEQIGVVLSGMSTLDQTKENLKISSASDYSVINYDDKKIIDQVKDFFNERMLVNCTNCKYCMPCPKGVNIPECFWAYNHDSMFNDKKKAEFWINGWLMDSQKPSNCINCKICESKCPQNIDIAHHLNIIKEKYQSL